MRYRCHSLSAGSDDAGAKATTSRATGDRRRDVESTPERRPLSRGIEVKLLDHSTDPIRSRAVLATKKVGPIATVLLLLFAVGTYAWTDVYARLGVNPGLVPLLALGALLSAGALIHREKMGWAFTMTTLTILFTVATLFVSLYPRVMVSSLNPEWSLTIYNASSTPYTLEIMSIVAGIFVPIVLAYQAWTYWVFRHRITAESKLEY